MFSTATKASFAMDNSAAALLGDEQRKLNSTIVLDTSIFGTSSARFASQNQNESKQKFLPGPGNYYGFGAGNFNPGQKDVNNVPINDSRALDDQWNNKSFSTKFSGLINHQMGLTNMNMEAVMSGKINEK